MFLYYLITYTGYLTLLINTILFFKSPFTKKRAFKTFCFYLLITCVIQLSSQTLFTLKKNNLYLSHYYFIGQFLFLSFFYLQLIKKALLIKIITTIVCFTLATQYYLKPATYFSFNLLEIVLCSLPLTIYAFIFFTQNIDGKNKYYLYINSGIFIYILSSTLIFSAGNFVSSKHSEINKLIWKVNVFLYLIYQILIFIDWNKNFRKLPE